MRIISPKLYATLQGNVLEIQVNQVYFPTNQSVTLSIQSSENENFVGTITEFTPTSILVAGSSATFTNGVIPPEHKGKKITLRATVSEAKRFVRVKVAQGSSMFHSNSVYVPAVKGTGTILSKIIQKDFLPKYISFHDIYEIVGDVNHLGLKVEVTNNASASSPVWENATSAYLNGVPYTFTNKPSSNYAVQVKLSFNKTTTTCNFCLYKMRYVVS